MHKTRETASKYKHGSSLTISTEAITAALQTGATSVADSEVARRNVVGRAGISVQLVTLPPLWGADIGVVDLVGRSDRTEILVTLIEVPPDVVSPSLIAQIHEGTCLNLESGPVRATEEGAAAYSLTPSCFRRGPSAQCFRSPS